MRTGVRAQTRLAAELQAAHEDLARRAAADERQRIAHIFMKLGLRDRAAAIIYAFDAGLATPRR